MVEGEKELLGFVERVTEKGRVVKGINEVTKEIERGNAKLVIAAQDVDPKEIIMHLPVLCKEKGIPYKEVSAKAELGKAVNLPVNCSAIAVIDFGELEKEAEKFLK